MPRISLDGKENDYYRTSQTRCGRIESRSVVTVSGPLLWVTDAGCAGVQHKGRVPRVEWCHELHCRGSHASCTRSPRPNNLYTMSGSTQGGWEAVPRSTLSGVPRKLYTILGPQHVVRYLGPHASCTLSRPPRKLCGGSCQGLRYLGSHANWMVGSTYRKLWNVAGSGARRELGQSRHIEIISFLQFGNGWSTMGSTYRCIGNSRMWLARAPDGSWAIAVA